MKCINCETQILVGQKQCSGCGVKVDDAHLSIITLSERAEAGDATAQGELAKFYLLGKAELRKNYEKAKQLFQAAHNQGAAIGYYGCGWFSLCGYGNTTIDYDKALMFAKKAVEMNCLDGIRLMGYIF